MLTRNGYKRKTYDEVLTEVINRAKQLFGENINTSERSIMGIMLRIMAWFFSLVWKDNEDVYYSAYPSTATGVQLDRVAPYGGVSRNSATYSIGSIQLNGTPNAVIPAGFGVAKGNDVFFITMEDIQLDENGVGKGLIVAQEPGENGNVAAGTITEIVNPSADVESVTNPEATEGGREKETDQELRERFYTAREGMGSRTTPSIRSAVLNVPSVRAAAVINNTSDVTDQYGTPANSFQTFVLGGLDEDIAQAILDVAPLGIRPYGTTELVLKDDSGNDQTIGFTRAVEIPVYIKVTIKRNPLFPTDGERQIRSNIIRYIGGEDVNGSVYIGLNMGDSVILSKLIARVYQVEGIDDVYIEISKDGVNYDDSNITLLIHEVAQAHHGNIEVIVNV